MEQPHFSVDRSGERERERKNGIPQYCTVKFNCQTLELVCSGRKYLAPALPAKMEKFYNLWKSSFTRCSLLENIEIQIFTSTPLFSCLNTFLGSLFPLWLSLQCMNNVWRSAFFFKFIWLLYLNLYWKNDIKYWIRMCFYYLLFFFFFYFHRRDRVLVRNEVVLFFSLKLVK